MVKKEGHQPLCIFSSIASNVKKIVVLSLFFPTKKGRAEARPKKAAGGRIEQEVVHKKGDCRFYS